MHALRFGPGRFVRTAYRVREGTPDVSPFCRTARSGGRLLAAIRYTAVRTGERGNALMLGPLAVVPEFAYAGIGVRLIRESLAEAQRSGIGFVVLVGDMSYYGRFGFNVMPPGQLVWPGPVDPGRSLGLELIEGDAAGRTGLISPERS